MRNLDPQGMFLDPVALDRAMMVQLEHDLHRWALPLLGLAEPTPRPRVLGEADWRDGVLWSVALVYGDARAQDGTLVFVYTSVPEWYAPLTALLRPGRETPLDFNLPEEHAELRVGARAYPAELCRDERSLAVRCHYQGAVATVVARDWPIDRIRLTEVSDIRPYIASRAELIERWAGGQR